jgi:tetratricopeptide (TPR) repeat protein
VFQLAEALEETDPAAAESAYRRLLDGNPGHANAYLNLGFMYCESARFREAAALYESAALHCAEDPLIHFNRGVALAALHRSAEAVVSYERALALQPGLADAHQNAALLYAQLGEQQHGPGGHTSPCLLDPEEVPALLDPLAAPERSGRGGYFCQMVTARRLRPLRRRLLITLRPPAVAMRARKPWVRARRVLCGWYVRFMTGGGY